MYANMLTLSMFEPHSCRKVVVCDTTITNDFYRNFYIISLKSYRHCHKPHNGIRYAGPPPPKTRHKTTLLCVKTPLNVNSILPWQCTTNKRALPVNLSQLGSRKKLMWQELRLPDDNPHPSQLIKATAQTATIRYPSGTSPWLRVV